MGATDRKRIFRLALVLVCLFTSGCGLLRTSALKASLQDLENAKVSLEVSRNLLKSWPVNSGFIKGGLGDRIKMLPCDCADMMAQLDELAKLENPSDEELGRALGLRVRAFSDVVMGILKTYAPDVIKYIPAIF